MSENHSEIIADNIVCKKLIIQGENGDIIAQAFNDVLCIWLTNNKNKSNIIGLVSDPKIGSYICFYHKKSTLPYSIGLLEDGTLVLQNNKGIQIKLDTLFEDKEK